MYGTSALYDVLLFPRCPKSLGRNFNRNFIFYYCVLRIIKFLFIILPFIKTFSSRKFDNKISLKFVKTEFASESSLYLCTPRCESKKKKAKRSDTEFKQIECDVRFKH